MNRMIPSDKVSVNVLVDNVSDILSRVPEGVSGEVQGLVSRGVQEMSGECLCCANWGLSLVVTTERDGKTHILLFDSGPEEYAIERNGDRLAIDFSTIEHVVLSHGHWDHAGGMLRALDIITTANGGRRVPFHVNPDMFVRRAVERPGNVLMPMKDIPRVNELSAHGAEVINEPGSQILLEDSFYLSGEIPRVTAYEKGLPKQFAWVDGRWEPDPLVRDERFLAVSVKDKGAIVFSACSHAGIINVLRHAREVIYPEPIYGVMGGFHLSGPAFEPIIEETVEDLRDFDLKTIVPGHCTGWRAVHALVNAFGDEVVMPSAVGRLHEF